jgi:AAA family ATP:ADP antiporter
VRIWTLAAAPNPPTHKPTTSQPPHQPNNKPTHRGLANDTTSLRDAPTLYPLFGLGANLAQACAGMVLKATTAARQSGGSNFVGEVQAMLGVVLVMAALAVGVHGYVTATQPRPEHQAELPHREPGTQRVHAAALAGAVAAAPGVAADEQQALLAARLDSGAAASTSSSNGISSSSADNTQATSSSNGSGAPAAASSSDSTTKDEKTKKQTKDDKKLSLRESFAILAGSLELRCLAVMSLAQGLCTTTIEFALKSHLRLLYPSPSDFTGGWFDFRV